MSQPIRLLLVEDEEVLAGVVAETLEMKGFAVAKAVNGVQGMELYHSFKPAICVVDVMMPKKDGITLVQEIRAIDNRIPLVFLTAKSEIQDVLKGFRAGADDYIKKPFSMEELILRIHALLKRSMVAPEQTPATGQFRLGEYVFDHSRQELHHGNGMQRLSQREADMLKILTDNIGNITSRKDMLMELWGDDSFFNARNMDVYITRLRKYLRFDNNIQIINIRARGFKLIV
ncbi:response regulator transcription factor [Chitinophaga polysaccharea]|uniref:response regulator transcription factor n=1 Tax=Chitinophaga TaxID=79328 RepID=UPI0014552282|nr:MULTISPECIES: response regulator transcription factor [Chitinophaga]NLR57716.1 response regulator transcription factor [Chitinophaga polysaccharea]NLU93308.1 response regulator transcription factor [Chitinophaga sp. Ak27]